MRFIKVESGVYLFVAFFYYFYKVQQLLKRTFHHKEQADSLHLS